MINNPIKCKVKSNDNINLKNVFCGWGIMHIENVFIMKKKKIQKKGKVKKVLMGIPSLCLSDY